MNIAEYISSGIVESYVLGLADEEERQEFERLCGIYPQLTEARVTFELALEKHVLAGAKQPPQHVRTLLLPKIEGQPVSKPIGLPGINGHWRAVSPRKGMGIFMYLAAASMVAVVCCGWFLYRLHVQNSHLEDANKQLLAKFKHTDSTLNSLVNEQSIAGNRSLTVVHLAGAAMPVKPLANIYWDSASAEVYMVVKNLPVLPPDKQYQLWARVNGKPKSLGVFDAASDKVILKMRDAKKAEAFAITVEPKGGNTSPGGSVQAAGKAK